MGQAALHSIQKIQDHDARSFKPNLVNRIVHSRLQDFEKIDQKSGLSIKYVTSGKEQYRLGSHDFTLTPGKFLVVNKNQLISCNLRSNQVTEGFCFYLDEHLMKETYRCRTQSAENLLENPFEGKEAIEFYERLFSVESHALGRYISSLADKIKLGELLPDPEVYYRLCDHLLDLQLPLLGQINELNAVKYSTRLELFRRLEKAKQLIQENFTQELTVLEIAREACLSEYHLARSFKSAFGISPYQYMLDLRIQLAKEMLQETRQSVSEVAIAVGFNDLPCFSKAFKKNTGIAPSTYLATT